MLLLYLTAYSVLDLNLQNWGVKVGLPCGSRLQIDVVMNLLGLALVSYRQAGLDCYKVPIISNMGMASFIEL